MKRFRLTGSSWEGDQGTTVSAYPRDYVGEEIYVVFEPSSLGGHMIDRDNIVFPIPHDFSAEEIPTDDA